MRWWQVEFEVPAESSEAASALAHEWPEVGGVAVEGHPGEHPPHREWGEWFDESLLRTTVHRVTFYLPVAEEVPEAVARQHILQRVRADLDRIHAAGLDVGRAAESVRITSVDESSWENAWKEQFRPLPVGKRLMVVPRWERDRWRQEVAEKDRDRLPVVLEPGMAFGTGTHETTQLCLETLERLPVQGAKVVDIGCGTAILSIAAARLGAARVLAVDVDPVAVSVARRNVADNGLDSVVEVVQGDLLTSVEGAEFDIALANILRDAVIQLAPQAASRLAVGGRLLASGFVEGQAAAVTEAMADNGLTVESVWNKGDWVAVVAVRTL